MGSRRRARDLVAATLLLALLAGGSGTAGGAVPTHLTLTAAAGDESDLSLDAGPAPTLVPGGPFVAAIAGLGAAWGAPRGVRLDAAAQGWYERFTAADDRTVASLSLATDLRIPWRRAWAWRVGAGGHLFDDSGLATGRRTGAWVEAGLVWARGPWRLEAQGGSRAGGDRG